MSFSKKRKSLGCFSTAMELMKEVDPSGDVNVVGQQDGTNAEMLADTMQATAKPVIGGSAATAKSMTSTSTLNSSVIHLTVRGIKYHKENIHSLERITLHREPENIHGTF